MNRQYNVPQPLLEQMVAETDGYLPMDERLDHTLRIISTAMAGTPYDFDYWIDTEDGTLAEYGIFDEGDLTAEMWEIIEEYTFLCDECGWWCYDGEQSIHYDGICDKCAEYHED